MLEKTIILDGFSKTYAMTGWRMGYGVMPEWLVDAVNKLMVNSNSCTASFTQRAGIAALTGPQDCVDAMVAEFRRRRDIVVAGLNEIPGFRCPVPGGAFYAFPNVTGTGMGSKELADFLLYEAGVAGTQRRLLRRIRRRLHPLQLRQLAGEPARSHRPHTKGLQPLASLSGIGLSTCTGAFSRPCFAPPRCARRTRRP